MTSGFKGDSKAKLAEVESDQQSMKSDFDPPPPYVSSVEDGEVQTFDVRYKDWKCIKALVRDTTSGNDTYQLDLATIIRSNIILRSTADDSEIGKAQFNPFKKSLAVKIHGDELTLRCKKMLSADYSFESTAFSNQTMTWKFHSGWSDMYYVLVDEQSLPVARWSTKGCGVLTKLGKVEFLGRKADSKEAKEEVLLTGMTLLYLMIQQMSATVVPVASSSS